MKKLLSICLGIVMMSLCFCGTNYSKVKASEKKTYSVKVGKKITLTSSLKNAVWGSDDISIAKVTSKGVVKGKSAGTCTIVATADGKSELFTVKVTKAKTKVSPVQLLTEGVTPYYTYNSAILKEYPVVVFDGVEISLYQSKYSEIYDALSVYKCQDLPGLNDIMTGEDTIKVYKNDKLYAKVVLVSSTTKLAKDAVIVNIELGYPSSSKSYYFNKNFMTKNMPSFDSIKESDLFSISLPWTFGDWNDNNVMFKYIDKETLKALPEKYAFCYFNLRAVNSYYNPGTLFCVFDVETHECILVTMVYI